MTRNSLDATTDPSDWFTGLVYVAVVFHLAKQVADGGHVRIELIRNLARCQPG